MVAMTEPPPTEPSAPAPPPDPDRYDSARDARARAKGMPGPYITGGEDPDLATTLVQERRLVRRLVTMVVLIVAGGFVIGTILALLGPTVAR
jgi:hypothetical protein